MNAKRNRFDLVRPYDVDLEQQLLGKLLLWNEHLDRLGFLEPHHFADPLHQRIYEAIVDAVRAGQTATPFSLKNEFENDVPMKAVGGPAYLAQLAACAANCLDALQWARMLHNLAFRRQVIQVARDIQDDVQNAPLEYDAERLAAHAERMLADAVGNSAPSAVDRFRPVGDVAGEVIKSLTSPKGEPAVLFGLKALDDLMGGMRPKELIIVGARPGMGKTAVAGHFARMAARQGKGVAFFSMEMSAPAVTLRLITSEAYDSGSHVAYEAARRGDINGDDHEALVKAEGDLRLLPIRVHEGRGLTPSSIGLTARRLQAELAGTPTPLGLVIVDHIQKIRPDRDCKGNKVAEMTETSDALQKMAGGLNVPVIALSQLNRSAEGRGTDRRPELSDLRESGAIEQDADVVLLLYREAYYLKKSEPERHSPEWPAWMTKWQAARDNLDIHIAKQRNGPEGRVRVHFDAPSSALKDK